MGKALEIQKKTALPKRETNELPTQKKLNSINRKQTPVQSSTQTLLDLWISAMRESLQFRHRNPQALSIQDSPIHSERTLLHKQPQHP
jgi:hypothetical protein